MNLDNASIPLVDRIALSVILVCVLLVVSECRALARSRSNRRARQAVREAAGPKPVYVDLDVLAWIESGGDPKARSKAGARGMYQLTRGAWRDAVEVLKNQPGREEVSFDYDRWVEDPTVGRYVAHTFINHVLPRQLTAKKLDRTDTTLAVPDTLETRLAAYNAGALRVREAFAVATEKRPWKTWLPKETQEFLKKYEQEAARRLAKAAADAARSCEDE